MKSDHSHFETIIVFVTACRRVYQISTGHWDHALSFQSVGQEEEAIWLTKEGAVETTNRSVVVDVSLQSLGTK